MKVQDSGCSQRLVVHLAKDNSGDYVNQVPYSPRIPSGLMGCREDILTEVS